LAALGTVDAGGIAVGVSCANRLAADISEKKANVRVMFKKRYRKGR